MTDDAPAAPTNKGGFVTEVIEIVKTVTVALLIALVLRIFLFQPYTIPSGSEEPNLYQGDYIIVSKYSYGYSKHSIPFSPPLFNGRIFFHAPRRGDIIVFKLPSDTSKDYIKRLMGLPGDHIQVKAGIVYINGKPLPRQFVKSTTSDRAERGDPDIVDANQFRETNPEGRSYLSNSFTNIYPADNTGVYVVPPHCYFMMGDNRDNSLDSRFDPGMEGQPIGPGNCGWDSSLDLPDDQRNGVGFVPEQNLEGRAQLILLSWNRNASLFKPWTWFLDAKPSRFFHVLK